MIKIVFVFGFLAIIISCININNQAVNNSQNSIIGTWNMIGVYENYGQINPERESFTDGFNYTFNVDRTFYSNRFNCVNGTYILNNNNYVTVSLNCSGNQINLPYKFTLENDFLVITLDSNDCDEGCPEEKFERIN